MRLLVLSVLLLPLLATPALASPDPATSGRASPALATDQQATQFGSYVQVGAGQSFPEALRRTEDRYGRLDVVRLFRAEPGGWDAQQWAAATQGRQAVISFRVPPAQVLSGRYDAAFRTFFRSAPTDRRTWWTYYHEPDVAWQHGELRDRAQYRAAFQRLARLARAADNPRLQTTVVLVGWTANPKSGQRVQDYWPGAALTDVVAWDVYNGWATRDGSYGTTDQVDLARRASQALHVQWGLAEFGSQLVRGDDGSGRARWLRTISRYADDHGAQFAAYFDTDSGPQHADYRLTDTPSRLVWRAVLSGAALH